VYTQVRVTLILIQYAPPPLLHRLPFKGNMCKLSTCSVDITFNTNTVKSVKRAPARLTSGTVWAYICTTSDTCMVIRERAIHAESGCSVDVLKYSCSVDIFYRSGGGGRGGGGGGDSGPLSPHIWVIYVSYMCHICVIYVSYGSYMGHIWVIYVSYMCHMGHICVIYG